PPVKRTATAAAKDTVAVAVVTKTRRPLFSLPGRKEQAPRKDTIIMMNDKGNVSNPPPPKSAPSRDSLVASNTSKKAKPSADSALTLRKKSPRADSTRSTVVNKAPVTPAVPDNGKEQVKKQDTALAVINSPVRPTITKAADFFTDSGYESVFIDASEKGSDTIRLSIPFAPKAIASPNNETRQETAASSSRKDSTPVTATDTALNAAASTAKTGNSAAALPNSDCKEIAWDSDIDKLRIKMLLVNTDDEKITVAKKVYRQKCFSVKQVKALTELFKEDEGKYKWFDAVYPYVSDSGHFASLAELLKTDYYLNRFKAMLRN
ncbi:MAG TPA: DUF4476 domain-containing protein, partial [Chitinophagaceae bacterium]|nr:DUF4476 domain-containing protein [Chitinophagaceae bacterium]